MSSGSGNSNSNSSGNRNGYSFPDFSLRRLLLQTRAARSPYAARLCDVERGANGNGKGDKNGCASSSMSGNKSNLDGGAHSSAGHSSHFYQRAATNSSTQRGSESANSSGPSSGGQGNGSNHAGGSTSSNPQECPLCYSTDAAQDFYVLLNCKHMACRRCLESYLTIEIFESRTEIACPECTEAMHPSDIQTLLRTFPTVMKKYEDFMVRRVLLCDPDTRWCPAPDCSYAVIATGCASCPRIKCERPGCDLNFCYHCKAEWHPDQTCDAARASRQSPMRAASGSISQDSQHRSDDIKPCPRCQVLIVKMDDGSCNHMVCAVCGSEFCWLCMKEISDLHYLSPSGCTFWGKKPWSRKKKLLWQLGTLVGAPVGIALVAGIAVPAMIIGIPVWIGRKLHTRYRLSSKHKRNCAVLGGVAASVLVSPVLAGLAVAIGVPILLFYVYGVVPVSLCRAGCAVSTTRDGFKFDFDEEDNSLRNQDASSVDAVSRIGATSIGEVSLSVASGSHLGVSTQNGTFILAHPATRESTTALAGSITGHKLEVQADVSTSETASAVTCVSERSGNTHDNASTKALAGSVYRQEFIADKTSVGSGRSYRSYGDDLDSTSLSSHHKRINFSQHMPSLIASQHRKISLDSGNGPFPEEASPSSSFDSQIHDFGCDKKMFERETTLSTTSTMGVSDSNSIGAGTSSPKQLIKELQFSKVTLNLSPGASVDAESMASTATNSVQISAEAINCGDGEAACSNAKNMSKAAMLRHLFFAQNSSANNAPIAALMSDVGKATPVAVISSPTTELDVGTSTKPMPFVDKPF